MNRLFGLSVSVLLIGAMTLSGQDAKKDAAGTTLYPLKKDAVWTYDVGGADILVKVVAIDKIGSEEGCYKLETTANGKVSATEHVKVKADGVYRFAVNGQQPDAPIKFLQLPADDKATWKVDTKVQGQEIKGDFVISKEDVEVPAGKYPKATLVESKNLKIGTMDTSLKCWYAENVGIVKLEFKLGGQDATLQLKKYEAGK